MTQIDGPAGAPSTRLARNSLIVGGATVLSRVLGFIRDILIARLLGAGPIADAFLVAFRLPNMFRRVLSEGGLNAPFVPVYLAVKGERGDDAASHFAGNALAVVGLGLLALVALTEIIAPWLVLAIAGGFRDEPLTMALAESYTRLALPFLALTTLASLVAAILNANGRFTLAAVATLALNLVMIPVLLLVLARGIETPQAAKLLALAVTIGGLAHLLLVVAALASAQPGWPRLRLGWSPDLTRLFRLAGPSLAAASTSQIVLLVATQIASAQPGAVSWLYYADRVFQFPLGFVAVAMGVVLLPAIAACETAGDADGRVATVDRALGFGLALALPAAAALVVLAEPIVAVLFERGRFGAADRIATAAALQAFAVGLPFAVIAKVLSQVFFARQTPRYPLIAGLVSLAAAILIGWNLPEHLASTGAAAAASAAFVVQATLLLIFVTMLGLWQPSIGLVLRIAKLTVASTAMAFVVQVIASSMSAMLTANASSLHAFGALLATCLAGIAVFLALALLMRALGRDDMANLSRSRNLR
jgi:putative peptidoglycan lipid II flippase